MQQSGDRRDTARGARSDDAPYRWLPTPQVGQRFEQTVSAIRRIDASFGSQRLGPNRCHYAKQHECLLPVCCITLRHKVLEPVEIQSFGLDLIQQPRKIARQMRCMIK